MKIPLIVYLAFYTIFLPIVVGAIRWRRVTRAHRLLLGWLVATQVASLLGRVWVLWIDRTNNMIVSYAFLPVQSTLVLLAVAEWQVQPVARRTVRYCIPLLIVWWALVLTFFEDRSNFSVLGGPILGLVVLAASLFALVSRVALDDEAVLRSSAAWILAGVAVYFATNATLTILQAVLTSRQDWPRLVQSTILKSYVEIIAMLLITWGYIWARPASSFGTSSSPSPSR